MSGQSLRCSAPAFARDGKMRKIAMMTKRKKMMMMMMTTTTMIGVCTQKKKMFENGEQA